MTITPQTENKILKWIHITQIPFLIAIIGLTAYRMTAATRPTRLDFWPMIVAVKSLVFLAYEMISEHYGRFNSLKANFILNIIEVIFWTAAIPITMLGLKVCSSTVCIIIGVIILIVAFQFIMSIIVLIISYRFHKYYKAHGIHPKDDLRARPTNMTDLAKV